MIHVIIATSNQNSTFDLLEEICPNTSGYFQWDYFLIETILRTNYPLVASNTIKITFSRLIRIFHVPLL